MEYFDNLSYDQVKEMYAQKGYVFHEGKYGANLGALRNKDTQTVDEFNDRLFVAYLDAFLNKHLLIFSGTTKPGLTSLQGVPMNKNGTFILCPGQYLNCWKVGYHHESDPVKRYEAYQQIGPKVFKGWRDNDKDGKFDYSGPVYDDVLGLNGHRAGVNDTTKVGPYGFACQVVQDDKEHAIWLAVGKRHAELYGNSLNYTLFQLQ
jgi:hypothetical protein